MASIIVAAEAETGWSWNTRDHQIIT